MVMETAKILTAGRNHFAKQCFSGQCTAFAKSWLFSLLQTKAHKTVKWDVLTYGQDITGGISIAFYENQILHGTAKRTRQWAQLLRFFMNKIMEVFQYE